MAMDAAPSAPPAVEAGEQPVTVNLQGTIELQSD
jgi:predicted secreted protein